MKNLFQSLFPNVVKYENMFIDSLKATAQMFIIAGVLTLIIGGTFGIILIITKPDGIKPNKAVHAVFEVLTNVFRSIPFIILHIISRMKHLTTAR